MKSLGVTLSKYYAILILLIFSMGWAHRVAAQIQPEGSVSIIAGIPVSEFAENVDHAGFGISFNGGVGLSPAPVMIGVDLGYLLYGYEEQTQSFSVEEPDYEVLFATSNSIAFGHLFFRVQPQYGWFQPYAEALFGFKYLFTSAAVKGGESEERIEGSENFDDWAASYGIGGGLDLKVFERERDDRRPYRLYVNAGARYLLGASASYLDKGATSRIDGEVVFDVDKSRTDMIIPQLGVSISF